MIVHRLSGDPEVNRDLRLRGAGVIEKVVQDLFLCVIENDGGNWLIPEEEATIESILP